MDLVERLPPLRANERNRAPRHLPQLTDALDSACLPRAPGDKLYVWVSVPPGHWKTTTLCYGAVKHLARWPDLGVAYFSHGARFAEKQSRDIRRVCGVLGWATRDDANRKDEWELLTGGGLLASGIGAIEAGRRFRLIIVDDPFKNREQANSPTERQKIFDAIEEDAIPRLLPGGALILLHTRWHPDDTIGRYKKRSDWRGFNIPAIRNLGDAPNYEGGEALLPEVAPLAELKGILAKNPTKFFGLYQGEPRPRGAFLFSDPATYVWGEQPTEGRFAHGVDLAYSEDAQAKADFSVCLRLLRVKNPQSDIPGPDGKKRDHDRYYVVDVIRKQVDAPSFTLALKAAYTKCRARMLWEWAGTEKGVIQFMMKRLRGILRTLPAKGDPFQRAQEVAEAWNEGRVLIPRAAEITTDEDGNEVERSLDVPDWVEDFKDEVTSFTGVKDPNDDQVAALASAFKQLQTAPARRGGGITEDDPGFGVF